uniref:Uncharacterized protein LOC101497834 isoform X2 n=1 Tax=Cicer arietinum TaxID=3827 RepID=A0A1S2Z3K8_CICAR|nr:uncharacterized protein LOC101497834 isoform X2 [Cicer arietinum]
MSPAKGSRLENSWIKRPTNSSSRVTNFPRKRVIDELSHQNVMNQVGLSTNWRKHPKIIYSRKWIRNEISKMIRGFPIDNKRLAPILEYFLYLSATSKEDYMNNVTLNQRVQLLLDAGIADYNGMPKEGPSTFLLFMSSCLVCVTVVHQSRHLLIRMFSVTTLFQAVEAIFLSNMQIIWT